MLTQEDAVEILVLLKQGMGVREVARRCGVSRNTVRRVRDEGSARQYSREGRASKLDAFRGYLAERIAAAAPKWIPASVLLREIKARGYTGSHTILRAHLSALRPKAAVEPLVRFETAPGVQMQLDWAEFRLGAVRWYLFVTVLGFSRWLWGRFVDNQRFETLRDLHVEAFRAMGGVPREALYDNMATVVIERDADGEGRHRFHAGMSTLARDYNFRLRLRAACTSAAASKPKSDRFRPRPAPRLFGFQVSARRGRILPPKGTAIPWPSQPPAFGRGHSCEVAARRS